MDSITSFIGEMFSGVNANVAIALGTLVVLIVIVSIVLALTRRIDRLEESIMDLRQLQRTMQDTQTDHARVVASLASIEGALPDLAEFKHQLSSANSQQSELMRAIARLATDLESMREVVASSVVGLKADSMTIKIHGALSAPRRDDAGCDRSRSNDGDDDPS